MSYIRDKVEAELSQVLPDGLRNCSNALIVLALADLMDEKPSAAVARELRAQFDVLVEAVQEPEQPSDPIDELRSVRDGRRSG